MAGRRSLAHLRSPSRDMVVTSVQMHRQCPSGPRSIGWAVKAGPDRALFVAIDGNQDWFWTTQRREASLFLTKATADRWIGGNLAKGAGQAVEIRP